MSLGRLPETAVAGGFIDVWLADYGRLADPALLERMLGLLSAEERLRQSGYLFEDDRRRCLVTRALVRIVLSRYAAVEPERWEFAANAYGRPEIAGGPAEAGDLCFNVSHSHGLIALAVSRGRRLGVDVEHVRARPVSAGLADRFFAPEEAAELAGLAPPLRQERFFEYWTFKEAYVKARGMGLSLPLDQFSFQYPDPRSVRMAIRPELGDCARRWRFWQYRPSPDHLLAVCVESPGGAGPEPRLRRIVPMREEAELRLAPTRRSAPDAA